MCHIIGIEPQFENIISNGPFVLMAAGQRKPEAQCTANERKAANLDQRLKSLIMSMLLDDQMNSSINLLTAKSIWDDLILCHEGPSDVNESRVMDLKLCYNTFKFKEGDNTSIVIQPPFYSASKKVYKIGKRVLYAKRNKAISLGKVFRNESLTQDLLLGPAYNMLKGTCTSNIELEYNFPECFNALTDKLDLNNPEGDRYHFDLSKPLPLQGRLGHLTIAIDYFLNNDLEYLKNSDLEKTYTTSIMKTKAAWYEIVGIEDMTLVLWSTIKHVYDKDSEKGKGRKM
nr:hypothetical protein [Tanacetum cinerariifolium]